MIQAALEAKEAVQKEEEADEEQGLWHKVEWKMAHTVFERTELSLSERAKGRIGNNFYKVGYRCPKCKGNLHMIMYPKGKEFRIETPEGVVLLAKACTCAACHRFYTPRPWKLLGDGDIYLMDFEEDKKAYEDYLELMGRNGEHEAQHRLRIGVFPGGQIFLLMQRQTAVIMNMRTAESRRVSRMSNSHLRNCARICQNIQMQTLRNY